MQNLVWSEECVPDVDGGIRDGSYNECCSARFEFSAAASGRGYFPNECRASPEITAVTIGPLVVDMEVISDGIEVDDELVVDGDVYEPGAHLVTLGSGTTATGASFSGGRSLCNGRHVVTAGKVLAVAEQGSTITLGFADNHGIDIEMSGAFIVRAVQAP